MGPYSIEVVSFPVGKRLDVVLSRPTSSDYEVCKICKLRVSSWNVGTMDGRTSVVVVALGRRHIDICCAQESLWKDCSTRLISAKGFKYKFIWSGDNSGFGGVGVLLNENWIDKVISVVRLNHRIVSIRILVDKSIINIFSVYALQTGLSVVEKDSFYSALLSNISTVSLDEYLLVCGNFNGHVGKAAEGFNGVHGGCGFGSCNADGTRILDLCIAVNLAITNTYFMKPDSHLVTYRSGNSCTQVDYNLTRRSDLKQVQNVKVNRNEGCVTQHELVVCEINLRTQIRKQHKHPPKRRIWKLRKPDVQEKYKKAVEESINSSTLLSDPDSEADVE